MLLDPKDWRRDTEMEIDHESALCLAENLRLINIYIIETMYNATWNNTFSLKYNIIKMLVYLKHLSCKNENVSSHKGCRKHVFLYNN